MHIVHSSSPRLKISKGCHSKLMPLSCVSCSDSYFADFRNVRSIKAEVKFDNSHTYNFGDADQGDWNKLMGIHSGTNRMNCQSYSVRWGWRWNPASRKVELSPYIHHGNPDSPEWSMLPSEVVEVELENTVCLEILIDLANEKYSFWVDGQLRYEIIASGIREEYENGQITLFYFGGNKKAPQTMYMTYRNLTVLAE